MNKLSAGVEFDESDLFHPHGNFPAINIGIMLGQCSKKPTYKMPEKYKSMMESLLADDDFQDIADYHCCGFPNNQSAG